MDDEGRDVILQVNEQIDIYSLKSEVISREVHPYLHDPFSSQLLHNSVLKRIGLGSLNFVGLWSSCNPRVFVFGMEGLIGTN